MLIGADLWRCWWTELPPGARQCSDVASGYSRRLSDSAPDLLDGIDPELWFEMDGCPGRHYLLDDSPCILGRMYFYCPIRQEITASCPDQTGPRFRAVERSKDTDEAHGLMYQLVVDDCVSARNAWPASNQAVRPGSHSDGIEVGSPTETRTLVCGFLRALTTRRRAVATASTSERHTSDLGRR